MKRLPPVSLRQALEAVLGFLALAGFSRGGEAVRRALHLPIPGTVIGLLMMLLALRIVGRVPTGLRQAAKLLIAHLNLFFIPAAVGVTAYVGLLRQDAGAIALALVLGTWLALAAGAWTFQAVAARSRTPRP